MDQTECSPGSLIKCCRVCGKEIKIGTICSACYTKEWNRRYPEKRKAADKRYYEKHKKEIIQKVNERNKKNPERHKELNRASHDAWIDRNRDRWNEYQRRYYRAKMDKGSL